MKKTAILFITLIFFIQFGLFSQDKSLSQNIINSELKLDSLLKKLRKSKLNKDFIKYNNQFKSNLKLVLENKDAFLYPFDSLKSTMSTLTSPDNKFRLFNWNVEMEDGVNKFYCYILKKDGKIIELKDRYRKIDNPELKSLSNKNWYGAVYYKIIKLKRGKYTLLGWNGDDAITTQKVIEVMNLKRKSVKFGETIFENKYSNLRKRRIVFKYANDAYVPVKYLETKKVKQIVFSHISPSTPQMKGHFEYYYPDLSYDNYTLERGKWVYYTDSEVKNDKSVYTLAVAGW